MIRIEGGKNMNMTQISAYQASLTIAQTTAAVYASGDRTFDMLMAIGQKNRAAQAEKPEEVELAAASRQETVSADSLFAAWANLTPFDERFANGDGTYSCLSRFLTMTDDYEQWKSGQADSGLPQSLGSEEADLAWLRERFSGELDAFGVIDAIESMRSMGLIDREERNRIYGIELTVVKVTEFVSCMQIRPAGYGSLWSDRFEDAPLMEFHSLQDILDWLGHFRKQTSASWELRRCELSARQISVTYESFDADRSAESAQELEASV